MRRFVCILIISLSAGAARAVDLSFSNIIQCDASDGRCDGGLAVSGAETSSIIINKIPGTGPVSVLFFVGESDQVSLPACEAPGRTLKIVVQKTRHFVPDWMSRAARNLVKPQRPP